MVAFSTDAALGKIIYGHGIEPGSTHCLSISSYTYDLVNMYGFARQSSQWTNVTFGEPVEGEKKFGNPVYRESDCIFRCPIDGSNQRNTDGTMRGRNGYIGRSAA
jgi:hypothetical protein